MVSADQGAARPVLNGPVRLLTIGFKGRTAEAFFAALERAGVQKVLDVRRANSSQLAGFTKGRDLAFFLRRCSGIDYEHVPDFGPSDELLREYRERLGHKKKDDAAWAAYVERYAAELAERPVAEMFVQAAAGRSCVCLLCSEETAERCHRRLLAEHLADALEGVEIGHL
jgi:uncharacterized protein (DUF488 family)